MFLSAIVDKLSVWNFDTDHLGSTDAITNAQGQVVEDLSFDAFGQKRSGADWSQSTSYLFSPLSITSKGYTGHEMLDEVGVIHMNGRTYDPRLGRFMQSDIFVDGARDTQGYNRYTYVRNNPLAYTDPSGFLKGGSGFGIVSAFAFGIPGIIFRDALQNLFQKDWFSSLASFGCTFVGPACSATVAALSATANGAGLYDGIRAGARTYVTSTVSQKISGGIAGVDNVWEARLYHGLLGGGSSVFNGGKFGHGFVSAFVAKTSESVIKGLVVGGEGYHKAIRATLAGIVAGTVSERTGGKFGNAAVQAAIQWMHNAENEKKTKKDPHLFKEKVVDRGLFDTQSDAARDFAEFASQSKNKIKSFDEAADGVKRHVREMAALIERVQVLDENNNVVFKYTYRKVFWGSPDRVNIPIAESLNKDIVGFIHTHPKRASSNWNFSNKGFSDGDFVALDYIRKKFNNENILGYLVNPQGALRVYIEETDDQYYKKRVPYYFIIEKSGTYKP